ncbi:putative transporter [Toxoplasma gondii RUB]|uniref:Putative transporter n=1 Tax=Toxoplasma gondii RUB TaxID=935652 RepID=A0A086M2B1_TOXGO|nr:putative transporter [Toxoplasma gondii RUB]
MAPPGGQTPRQLSAPPSSAGKPCSSNYQIVLPGEQDQWKPATRNPFVRLFGFFLRRLQTLMGPVEDTPAIQAAKMQQRPCQLNRFVLLAVYFVYALLTARVYFAWPNLSNLLFRNDAYIWLCSDNEPDMRLPENGERRYKCEAQNSEVGKLFVTCLAFAFSCSLVAGILLDFLGAKVTAMIGQLCNLLSWVLLAFAGEGCETYFPAFILMGVGSDVGYLPLLSSANLFPGHEGLVIALLGAAKSASFAMPTILDVTENGADNIHLKEVSLGYAIFGPGVCCLLAIFLVPLQVFKPWNEFVGLEEEDQPHPLVRVNDSFASYGAHAWRDSFSSFQEVKDWIHQHHINTPLEEMTTGQLHHPSSPSSLAPPPHHLGPQHVGAAAVGGVSGSLAGPAPAAQQARHFADTSPEAQSVPADDASPLSGAKTTPVTPPLEKVASGDTVATTQVLSVVPSTDAEKETKENTGTLSASQLLVTSLPPIAASRAGSVFGASDADIVHSGPSFSGLRGGATEEEKPANFWSQVFSKYAFGIIFYSVLKAIMYAFFTTGGENLLGKQVNDFMGAALPFSCLPCLVLGKVVDTVGIMPALLLLNSFITLAYGFSMIDSTFTAYLAAILYICYVSFYSSQSYCYVSDTFSSCHFGKLVGIIHMIAGFLSLLKIPMQSLVVHVFHSEYLYPCLIMLGFCLCNFIVLFWLVYLKRKDPHPFWSKSARDAVKKEQERQDAMKRERKEKRMQEKEARKRENEGRPAHAVEMA